MDRLFNVARSILSIPRVCFIDIGARGGLQRPWDRFPQEYLQYYGFEPDIEECNRLNNSNKEKENINYLPFAVSDKDSTENLYVTKEKGCSSFYRPDSRYFHRFYHSNNWEIKETIPVKTTTLSKIFDANSIKPDFLKVDTQGAELKVLKGIGKYFDNILGLEVETEFLPWYENQPLFFDVDTFIRAKGFELYDLNRYWAKRNNMRVSSSRRGQLIFGDAIYFRSLDSFYSLDFSSAEEKRGSLIKMVSILSLYGFFDVAMEFLTHAHTPFNAEELRKLEDAVCYLSDYPKWQKLLFNNKIAVVFGRALFSLGSLFMYKAKTSGWGTDYNSVDCRYPYHIKGRFSRYFRK